MPIVAGLTGREGEMDWHPDGIHDRVNLACQAAKLVQQIPWVA